MPSDVVLPTSADPIGSRLTEVEFADRVVEAAGRKSEIDRIARAHREAIDDPESPVPSWALGLQSAARSHELRVTWHAGTVAQAAGLFRSGMPMVTRVGEGAAAIWYLIEGRTWGRYAVTSSLTGETRWLSLGALSSEVAPEGGVVEWLLVEPTDPAETLIGGGGPDGTLPPWQRIQHLLFSEREDLGVLLVFAAGVGILGLATPIAVQVLTNTIAFGALTQPIVVLALILFVCLGFAAVLTGLQRIVVEHLQRRVFVRMVSDLAHRLPRVRAEAFDRTHGPELVNRFFDVLTVQKAANSLLLDGLSAGLQTLVGLALLALYHPVLLAFDVFLIACIALIVFVVGRRGGETAIVESKTKYKVAGWLEELAAHPSLFKLPGAREFARLRADALARTYLDAREEHFRVFFRQVVGTLALQVVAGSLLLGLGGWLVVERQLTLGQLVAAELVVASALSAFAKFAGKLDVVYDLVAAVDKLGNLVDLPLERASGVGSTPDGPCSLHLEGVFYAFEGGSDALRDVALDLKCGDRVAIVGPDGSGKSVLADVIAGVREPRKGHVALDGVNLRELRPEALRRATALVRGDEVVSGTVEDNIGLGRIEIDRERIHAVLAQVGLDEAIERLEQGVETLLAPGGSPLSHLQVRRLVLARALAGEPKLLVIDGTLDAFAPAQREALLRVLAQPNSPWTLVVLTQLPEVAGALPRRYSLQRGRLEQLEGPPPTPLFPRGGGR